MIGGTFRQSLSPLLAPCTSSFPIRQLVSLKQFKPNARTARTVTTAAATLHPVRQSSDTQWAAEFRSLGLSPELLTATQENGLNEPTEIQVSVVFVTAKAGCSRPSCPIQAVQLYCGLAGGWHTTDDGRRRCAAGITYWVRQDPCIPAPAGEHFITIFFETNQLLCNIKALAMANFLPL